MNEIGHPSFIAQLKGFLSIKCTLYINSLSYYKLGDIQVIEFFFVSPKSNGGNRQSCGQERGKGRSDLAKPFTINLLRSTR